MNLLLILLLISQGIATHGSSLYFDGDDYVDCGSDTSFAFTGQVTLEAWIKVNKTGINQRIIGYDTPSDPRYLLSVRDDDKGNFYINHAGGTAIDIKSTTTVTDGKWYYLVGLYNGTIGYIYVDGILENSIIRVINNFTASGLYIGAYTYGSPAMYFNGIIAEVRIYNRALDSLEIQWNYHHPSQPYDTSGLVGWWRFNEFQGDTLFDSSGNGNDGTITGATWTIDTPVISGKQK